MSFNNLKVSSRLGLGFGFMLLLLFGVAALGYTNMSELNAKLQEMTDIYYRRAYFAQELSKMEYVVARDMRTLVIVEDPEITKGAKDNIDAARKRYQDLWDRLNKLPISEAGKVILAKVKEARELALPFNNRVIELGLANKPAEATAILIKQAFPANRKVQGLLEEYVKLQDDFIKKAGDLSEASFKATSIWMAALVGFAILLGIVIAFIIVRSITNPLGGEPGTMAALTGQIASGDLTVRFTDTGKETGVYAAMRDMARQLKEIVSQVMQATGQVNSAAAEIAQGSSDLAQRTEEQASALEQTASSMEELTSTVKQSADNAGQANQLASAARAQAEQGGQVVDQAITAMSAINQSSR
ncbi:MAG: MCP four helix bundle domain-containing protein, partial [Candidatus Competibacter sp.]|nr:MCP four helix bundle domain-containing protein [Candidatus Competibacter sp.]